MFFDNDSRYQIFLKKFCENLNIFYNFKYKLGIFLNTSKKHTKNKNILVPDLLFIINSKKNFLLLKEAFSLNIPIISFGLNVNIIKIITYPIIGNFNNINLVKLILMIFYYILINSYKSRLYYIFRKKIKKD